MDDLSDSELDVLAAEHYPEFALGYMQCHAALDDACTYGADWPCRIARLIQEVKRRRNEPPAGSQGWGFE